MRIVLDGSITVSWFLSDEKSDYSEQVHSQVSAAELVCVPAHWMLEVTNALLVAERRKRIAAAAVDHATGVLRQMPVSVDRETTAHAGAQTLELARQYALSVYDAAYLELALRLGAALASLDEPLKLAAKKRGVTLL